MTNLPDPLANLSPERRELLERLQALQRPAALEPIAVVGMGCRFPGSVDGPADYWRLLTEGRDAVSEVPDGRWDSDDWYSPDARTPGKLSTRFAAFLNDIAGFDAEFFGVAPREAVYIDPQHRLLLEVAWESLEHAGIAPDTLQESPTGVFVGLSTLDYYRRAFAVPERLGPYSATGTFASAGAGRISYVLGLQGPCLALDTACSSSLVAVHSACQSLRLGECNMALAGGVSLMVSPELGVSLDKAHMLAADGRCKTFDASADGYGRGEGCGIVVLKRLSDARRDGDLVWAVIAGSAVNQDGRSNGLTAPNGRAQEALLRSALKSAGVAPADIGFIEAHGTGTALGDPIEVGALAAVLGGGRPADRPLVLGSVKTNIGHLEQAAGVAGLIKTVLCLHHRQLVPNLHFRKWNPQIAAVSAGVKLHVPHEVEPWAPAAGRCVAGVSSFGFGGTNAHVVVTTAPDAARQVNAPEPARHVLCLSAKSPGALRELAARYAEVVARHPEAIGEICCGANTGRAQFDCRLAVVAGSGRELGEELTRLKGAPEDELVGAPQTPESADAADPAAVLAAAYLRRERVEWRQFYGDRPRAGLTLPTYPFQRVRYWLDVPAEGHGHQSNGHQSNGHESNGHRSNGASSNGDHTYGAGSKGASSNRQNGTSATAPSANANGATGGGSHGTPANGKASNGANGAHKNGHADATAAAPASAASLDHAYGKNGATASLNGTAATVASPVKGAASGDPAHVRSIIENCLVRVLELPEGRRIAPDQDLGELGMDSITALELLFAVEKTLSRPLRMPGISKSRTINQFVSFIDGQPGTAAEVSQSAANP